MKKIILFAFYLALALQVVASNEKLEYLRSNSTWTENMPSENVQPCGVIHYFRIKYTIPANYEFNKFEWYVNGSLAKTSTNVNDYDLGTSTKASNTNVYCVVTYRNPGNNTFTTGTSNTLTITAKPLAIKINQLSDAIAGCANAVSFSTSTFTDQFLYTPPSYTASWLPPSGWTASTVSPDGHSASFIPDATTGGLIRINATLPCGHTSQIPISPQIVRTTPAPTFAAANTYSFCNGTTSRNFSINAACGASSYTYTLQGNPNSKFTANNSQTLTTSATTVTVSFQQNVNYTLILSVKANYPTGASSYQTSKSIYFGAVNTDILDAFWDDVSKIKVYAKEVPGARYRWSLNDVFVVETAEYNTSIPSNAWNKCNTVFDVGLDLVTGCGTSTVLQRKYYRIGLPPCDGGGGHRKSANESSEALKDSSGAAAIDLKEAKYKIAPNPVVSHLEIYANTATGQLIREVVVLDPLGAARKKVNLGKGVTTAKINVQELSKGIYFVRIYDGKEWTIKQILIGK